MKSIKNTSGLTNRTQDFRNVLKEIRFKGLIQSLNSINSLEAFAKYLCKTSFSDLEKLGDLKTKRFLHLLALSKNEENPVFPQVYAFSLIQCEFYKVFKDRWDGDEKPTITKVSRALDADNIHQIKMAISFLEVNGDYSIGENPIKGCQQSAISLLHLLLTVIIYSDLANFDAAGEISFERVMQNEHSELVKKLLDYGQKLKESLLPTSQYTYDSFKEVIEKGLEYRSLSNVSSVSSIVSSIVSSGVGLFADSRSNFNSGAPHQIAAVEKNLDAFEISEDKAIKKSP